ncbi:MAG: nucleotidyltransferase family protein [Candidatus Caldarchaeum sp.]|nr:nucleotidyltransferase family protein [Candidatus Caldarchaeum sp.]MCS7133700.1 nucleotidyltransferase family protein [Candidatus Caldarchaeum sp.]MCX8200744.1 nucleotidyltransferase family protein [Candidatus Caldarchaeum sp.]MDW8062751.1 nucleotidyltransferase family protein [Candidatus Caldarchaeum sp.]MDW8434653.1 nucleotidyltransferase family protein [Candidatus Caldarchaeum sp.]
MRYSTAVFANFGPGGRRGLIKINNRPMIEYVLEAVPDDSEEIFILSEAESKELYRELAQRYDAKLDETVPETVDIRFQLEPFFRKTEYDAVLALPCDAPLLTREVTKFLTEIITKFSAGIPRPVFDKSEFGLASYRVNPFLEAMKEHPAMKMADLVKHVHNVLYISAQSFRVFDDKLRFLMRVQNQADARRVAHLLQSLEET